ncbi:MAG: transposase family protein [Gemmatimonadales bacterium]|nr:transposase family protein [Gemmatimonadales bacterium]
MRGIWYSLHVVLDVFSRCVIGWRFAAHERGDLAKEPLRWCRDSQDLPDDAVLTLHADCGRPMTSKPVSELLVALGITRSHSRPHVPNDNPCSEAQFKALKYHATFPGRFGSLEDAERSYTAECFKIPASSTRAGRPGTCLSFLNSPTILKRRHSHCFHLHIHGGSRAFLKGATIAQYQTPKSAVIPDHGLTYH